MESRMCFGCMEPTDQPICPRCGFPQNGMNQPHQLPVGMLLRGQYVIGKVLGQGGFGITYLGWDRYLDTKVAIKEFYPSAIVSRDCTHSCSVNCSADSSSAAYLSNRERFLREAKALAKLESSSAIVNIKSFFEENNTAYIVMEYVKGTSLERFISLRGGKIPPQEAFQLLRPVMDALARVHEAGMVHRDISPDNIILHPMEGAKLLDFGAVRDIDNASGLKSTEAILKHGFAPMEQYQTRGNLGPWTDVYALCATIYYCLTGRIPQDAPARIMDNLSLDWDTIPKLTPHHRKVLHKGTALRFQDRYSSMVQFRDELFSSPESAPEPITPSTQPKIAPTPAPKPPVFSSSDWFCSCGYRNKSWHASCQSCGKHKPDTPARASSSLSAPAPKPPVSSSADWFCSCGYRNKSWHASCQSCSKHKP